MKERDHAGNSKSEPKLVQDEPAEKKYAIDLKSSRLQGRATAESQEMTKPRKKGNTSGH